MRALPRPPLHVLHLALVSTLLTGTWLHAAGPGTPSLIVPYQGHLEEGSGPVDRTVTMVFRLYDDETPANRTLNYSETRDVDVVGGRFAVRIGAVTPIPAAAARAQRLFLAIDVDGQPLSGLQEVHAALRSVEAHEASSFTVSQDLSVSRDVTVGRNLSVTGALTVDGDVDITNSGGAGIHVGDTAGAANNEAGDVGIYLSGSGELAVRRGNTDQLVVGDWVAVSGELRADADVSVAGVVRIGAVVHRCTYAPGASYMDCTCPDGLRALGGGTHVGTGALLRESRPLDEDTWRVACVGNNGARVDCGPVDVTCARIAN